MDLSSLPESEQEKLRQLQQRFEEHQSQQQRRQQYPDLPSQAYGYDQRTQPCYSYYHQYSQSSQQTHPPEQQHYAYYPSDYATACRQQQHEPVALIGNSNGAGVSVPMQQVQHNAYFPARLQGGEGKRRTSYAEGLTAAAAAAVTALSQLTQYSGTVAERAMVGFRADGAGYGPEAMRSGQIGMAPYRGGGRRVGTAFKRGGRKDFGDQHPRSGPSGPPSHGRGHTRGKRGPRPFLPHGVASSSDLELSATEDVESTGEGAEPSAPKGAQASVSEMAASSQQPSQVAWCELCKADCTSLEILEQHKNGKRHKKNLLKIERLKNAVKLLIPQQLGSAHGDEDNKPVENMHVNAVNGLNIMESYQQNTVGQPNVAVDVQSDLQARKTMMDTFDNAWLGVKRKTIDGHGGKRMRSFETPRQQVKPPKPKVVIPLICDLCNIKCDTQEVLNRHLSGKKHISKLKRYEGHQAMYGPVTLQALYPPNPIAQSPFGHQQAFNGHNGPQGSLPPPGTYMPPHTHHAAPPVAGFDPQFYQNPYPQ